MPAQEPHTAQIEIRLFASAADRAGQRVVHLPWQAGDTIDDVANRLCRQIPSLAPIVQLSRWAIDKKFVGNNALVDRDDEVALIPPVSGG